MDKDKCRCHCHCKQPKSAYCKPEDHEIKSCVHCGLNGCFCECHGWGKFKSCKYCPCRRGDNYEPIPANPSYCQKHGRDEIVCDCSPAISKTQNPGQADGLLHQCEDCLKMVNASHSCHTVTKLWHDEFPFNTFEGETFNQIVEAVTRLLEEQKKKDAEIAKSLKFMRDDSKQKAPNTDTTEMQFAVLGFERAKCLIHHKILNQ